MRSVWSCEKEWRKREKEKEGEAALLKYFLTEDDLCTDSPWSPPTLKR